MRAFLAIEISENVRTALAALEHDLKPTTSSARWVPPESIHLTLKFLGEVPDHLVPEIDTALVGLSWKPFTVIVRGIGFFPGNRSPRVFWAGLEASTMQDLAQEIDARMERLGFEKEKRAFRPHITLARARDTRIDASLVRAAQKYETHHFGSFAVNRFHLFRSTLKPTGAIYNKITEYPLESRR